MNGLLVTTKKLKITKNAKQIAVDICLNKRNRKGDDVDDDDDHNLGKKKNSNEFNKEYLHPGYRRRM